MIEYFSDPVLFAPTVGCMLMCFIAAIVGTFIVLKRESLLGETLSHAAYPGVITAIFCSQLLLPGADSEVVTFSFLFIGACLSSLAGLCLVYVLQRYRVSQDAALAVVLSSFFGLSMLLLSLLQTQYPPLYRKMQSLLFGQAATMMNVHVIIYSVLSVATIGAVVCLLRPLQIVIFDPVFSHMVGISKKTIHTMLFVWIVLATIVAIRSVGVVLLSAMLVFPAATGLFFVKRVSSLLLFSAIFSVLSGFFGVFISHELSSAYSIEATSVISFPTGPSIVLCASIFFFLAACFSTKRGLCVRIWRKITFLFQCRQENMIKALWKCCDANNHSWISEKKWNDLFHKREIVDWFCIFAMKRRGWIRPHASHGYEITASGMLWGKKIVRLHRLWEVYLVEFCKIPKNRVHPLAEEMEHIITDEMEEELTQLLRDPQQDPHNAPIPRSS